MSTSSDGGRTDGSKSQSGVLLRHCLAGVTSAAITKTLSAPLDRIMVHMQVTECDGFRAAVRHVYCKQGFWQGFWRGNGLNVLKSSPEFAVKFSLYDYVKRRLKAYHGDENLTSSDRFAAGAVAGVCSQTLMYPLENAKTRLIVGNHLGIADVLTKTYRTDGARGLYKGFWPNMASIFVYTGIFLMTYEHVKQLQYDRMAAGAWLPVSHEWMVHSISAMCSSVVGMILCYPISRIITRLQIENGLWTYM
ncbi:probable calcium-binding mitochondrial carrier CBG00135 [Sipha flava]|uniref:Probable calcium-binding mitochondrial carrier CBG00135 n=1 Tax=Sipha flava TaxID=143950 RepID=A0A8B8G9E6_9HEMI|nr:probable calcium-binding mitochondrial carrier CBG00135 [Sipha flava]